MGGRISSPKVPLAPGNRGFVFSARARNCSRCQRPRIGQKPTKSLFPACGVQPQKKSRSQESCGKTIPDSVVPFFFYFRHPWHLEIAFFRVIRLGSEFCCGSRPGVRWATCLLLLACLLDAQVVETGFDRFGPKPPVLVVFGRNPCFFINLGQKSSFWSILAETPDFDWNSSFRPILTGTTGGGRFWLYKLFLAGFGPKFDFGPFWLENWC